MSGSESVSKLLNYISKHNGKMIQGGKISSKKKPKCCWTYVNRDSCDHTSGLFDEGVILAGILPMFKACDDDKDGYLLAKYLTVLDLNGASNDGASGG
jgi:hypothetical protein